MRHGKTRRPLRWLYCLEALLLAAAGCGGTETQPFDPVDNQVRASAPEPIQVLGLTVTLDGRPYRTYTDSLQPAVIENAGIVIGKTSISFELTVSQDDSSLACTLAGTPLSRNGHGSMFLTIQAAYFSETLDLACELPGGPVFRRPIAIRAADPELENALAAYLKTMIPLSNDRVPQDPYSGYRRESYYSEFQRFVMLAQVYSRPELFRVDREGQLMKNIELYLINTAEAYFEPCADYDFDTGEVSQCRSPGRVGKYFMWRSPLATDPVIRSAHAMAEWRAGAGIAQAIKSILLRHSSELPDGCIDSDQPSQTRETSLSCRALNVRRLLLNEVWRKWTDEDWVRSLGYTGESMIQETDVAHWIALTELMVDAFHRTASIPVENCDACTELAAVPTRIDDLLGFFVESDSGYISISCRPPHRLTGCDFLGNDFQTAKSVDLSHLAPLMHLITMHDQPETCTSDRRRCYSTRAVAKSMNDQTWIDWIANNASTRGFPKFDLFFNGHCSRASFDESDPLHRFCVTNWLSESGTTPLHRNLFGFVSLGKYDRNLMIKLRQAADENHDGLLDAQDMYRFQYVVMLYEAISGVH